MPVTTTRAAGFHFRTRRTICRHWNALRSVTAQDVMEYSVWGSNDNVNFVLLSDVIGFTLGGDGPGRGREGPEENARVCRR